MVELIFEFNGDEHSTCAFLVVILVGKVDFSVNTSGCPVITPLDGESKVYVDRECSDSRWYNYFSFRIDDKRRAVVSPLKGHLSLIKANGISHNRFLAMQSLITAWCFISEKKRTEFLFALFILFENLNFFV